LKVILWRWKKAPHRGAAAGNPVLAHRTDNLVQRQVRLLFNQSQQKVRMLLTAKVREWIGPALGGHSEPLHPKNREVNHSFRMWGHHQFAWDFECLETAARQASFPEIEPSFHPEIERSFHNDPSAPYQVDGSDWWRPLESLYANPRA
jgi:hypothetical protein